MNTNIRTFLLCPVPENQKPTSQYVQLKEGAFTSWATLPYKKYQVKNIRTFITLFMITSFFHPFFWDKNENFWSVFFQNFLISNFLFSFCFLILLQRWKQIDTNFQKTTIFYEESSWYDGETWEKPSIVLKNDRLISSQKLVPIINRLFNTFLFSFFFFLSWIFIYFLFY
jgi:hypothetical protein